ncbi:MAG: transcriptional repressor [Candidatus Cloacimonetes bacterium]|nr:transcriptional repressor [Candidatus Cloacimonadota bacterium]
MRDAKRILEEKDISPSLQRVIILKYLQEHPNHPTVEDVYHDLIDDIPTLSKTTIYNTLKLFTQKGIVYQLAVPGNEAHYDYSEGYHAHLLCEECGGIFDIESDISLNIENDLEGHLILGIEVIYRGICRNCRKE